jgi:hypothetical protein
MSPGLSRTLAVWFVLQIVLPFTAPLQTCDLRDLMGAPHHHSDLTSYESFAGIPPSDTDPRLSPVVSPLVASTLRVSAALGNLYSLEPRGRVVGVGVGSKVSHHTVLRL